MQVLIIGANGFIGSHLCEAILQRTEWHVHALDLAQDKITHLLNHPRFMFKQGNMTEEAEWLQARIDTCDVVLPLAAIATPVTYVKDPLRIFELDFEANLQIIRWCVQFQKRLVFPSTSEVYGMCPDAAFDEETSHFVTGPIHKERWIYATSKQLLDRLIYAYGKHEGLAFSLFRPFNWYGPRLDNIHNTHGSRVLTQFIGNIIRGENIQLVNGGAQKRCFTYIDDGIDALLKIIENKNNVSVGKVFNLGNPNENISIKDLAQSILKLVMQLHPRYQTQATQVALIETNANEYYGQGYQDINLRVPAIERARACLNWEPTIDLPTGIEKTLAFYLA